MQTDMHDKGPSDRPARRKGNHRRLTEQNVLELRPKRQKQFQVWDGGTEAARGLSVLISPSGTKSYRVTYYFPGSRKVQSRHLGRVGEMTLEEARKRAREDRRKAREGIDPKQDDPTASDTVLNAIENYVRHEQIGRHGNKSAAATRSVMLKHCAVWNARPLATIRYDEVEHLLMRVRDGDVEKGVKPTPYMANRLYSHLLDFFNFCVRRRAISTSPMIGMQKPWGGEKPRERDWFRKAAGDEAIRKLWACAAVIGGDEERYLKLLLLTGKRRSALASMRWEQIEADWFWDAPPSRVKNKRLHGVPLPTLAQRILRPRQSSGLVFRDLGEQSHSFEGLQKRLRQLTGIEDFFFHGVRHLVETKMAELRDEKDRAIIPPHVRDLLLDHAAHRGSGHGYDHHDYKPEMRAAMEAWAAHVDQVVTPQGATVTLR